MRRKLRPLSVLISALALTAAACTTTDDTTTPSTADPFKVGILSPFTGDLSDFGPAMAEAVKLASAVFREAASKAGIDVNIVNPSEDSQTAAQPGTEAARKLVDVEQVKFIIGPMASGVTLPVAESVTIPKKILLITPSATSGTLTTLNDDGFVNRTPPSDEYQAPILANLVFQAVGAGAEVALGARNDAYGVFIINGDAPSKLNGVKQELEKLGVKTREPVFWDPKATTFDSEAQRLTQGSPAAWVLVDFPTTWQKISAALVRTGNWDPAKTFSADGLKTSKLPQAPPTGSGAQATEGMRGTAPGGIGTAGFNDLWNDRVKDIVPETFSPQAFDATLLGLLSALKAAVTKAGSTDGAAISTAFPTVTSEEIKNNLQGTSRDGTAFAWDKLEDAIKAIVAGQDINYEGVSGPVDLDKDGNVESVGANFDVYQFKDGKLDVTSVEKATALS